MREIAISVEKLGKLYQIGERDPYPTLRAAVSDYFAAAFTRLGSNLRSLVSNSIESRLGNGSSEANYQPPEANARNLTTTQHRKYLWALKDVSFQLRKGETLGIIGPNGSGKSTLLKLLARITEPSEGEIYIDGSITALLELGAGFHPELTGRENIYLTGAILGMSKTDIEAKFREIVEFADLWNFIDTPVKRYSTGMAVRLGFAAAVSVDPEILLVDEVLAVGDETFRKRCLKRIDSFIASGKTLVVVSHSLQEVQRIAHRAILIDQGLLKADGVPARVIEEYKTLVDERTSSRQVSENTL
jgi:lipopolysaccharide transport system ATP-binding protein